MTTTTTSTVIFITIIVVVSLNIIHSSKVIHIILVVSRFVFLCLTPRHLLAYDTLATDS